MSSSVWSSNSHFGRFAVCLLTTLMVVANLSGQAQTQPAGYCGSALSPELAPKAYQQHLALSALTGERSTTHYRIPVQMHVVRHDDGSGGFDPAEFPLLFDSANVLYQQANVELYQYQPPIFIDADFFFNNCSTSVAWDSLKRTAVVPGAINVYWVPDESGFPYCGISSFTSSMFQGIVMNNLCGGLSQPFNSTIVHEIGHYFNLYHTHETAFGIECPAENNCAEAGDLICDTPADPNIYLHVSAAPECLYDDYASTPIECDATPYNPPTTNLMSYSTKACEKFFTPQQIELFRLVLETDRTELEILAGSIAYRPSSISPLLVSPGTIADTTIRLTNIGSAPITVMYAGSSLGFLSVSGNVPATIVPGAFEDYIVSFDAGGSTGACDVGQFSDEVLFSTSDIELPEKHIPVLVNVVYSQPAVQSNVFGSNCLTFTVPNTPALGNAEMQALSNSDLGNVLFDASLLLGIVDGSDTIVYQDCYTQSDYAVVDGFSDSTDEFGRTTQALRFATKDGRLYGDVTYSYGWNSLGVDSCSQVAAVYKIRNLCDTTLSVAVGIFADFDVDEFTDNVGTTNPSNQAIYVGPSLDESRVVALANLGSGSQTPLLQVVPNEDLIWPTGQLPDNTAYRALVNPLSDSQSGDVGALLAYGKYSLHQNGEIKIPVAFLLSNSGPAPFQGIISNLKGMLNGMSHLCGDCNGNGFVNISDAVYLINYIFAGGPAPFPLEVGDVNCDGHVFISDCVYLIFYIFSGGAAPCSRCP